MFLICHCRNIFFKTELIILGLIFSIHAGMHAQRKYGNEWINYNQTYYKIKVVQNGIYRLSYSDLRNAGLNVDTLNPTHLQLFFRGAETAIYLSSGSKTSFGSGDYIEFYGQGNDGALDSVLYLNPADDINKSYSMYTDTAAYFLTIGSSVSNLRYAVSNKTYGGNPALTYVCEQDMYLHDAYYDGVPIDPTINFTGSDYNAGEGWMGANLTCFNYNSPVLKNYTINLISSYTPNDTTNLPKPELELLIYGKSDVANQNPDHHLEILSYPGKSLLWDTVFDGFKTIHKYIKRNWSDVYGKTQQTYYIEAAGQKPPSGTATSDEVALSFMKLHYQNQFNINPMNPNLAFNYMNASGGSQTDFNFTANTSPATTKYLVLYDITNHIRTSVVPFSGKNVTFGIDNMNNPASYILIDTTTALKVLSVNQVNFIKPNYGLNYNYIIITHKYALVILY